MVERRGGDTALARGAAFLLTGAEALRAGALEGGRRTGEVLRLTGARAAGRLGDRPRGRGVGDLPRGSRRSRVSISSSEIAKGEPAALATIHETMIAKRIWYSVQRILIN